MSVIVAAMLWVFMLALVLVAWAAWDWGRTVRWRLIAANLFVLAHFASGGAAWAMGLWP